MTAMHFSANFKSKMADRTLRDGKERSLYNFVGSLRTLLIGIQNLNTQDVSVDYFEQANLRLEDAILPLQLLLHSVWQSEDSVLQDFKTITEAVLTKVRFVFRVMTKYEERNSVEVTVSNSFACPTTKLTGAGRPVIVIEREQIEFLSQRHTWRFYTPIAANLIASDFRHRLMRTHLAIFFANRGDVAVLKTHVIKSPNLIRWLYCRFAAINTENRGNVHTWRMLANLIADI